MSEVRLIDNEGSQGETNAEIFKQIFGIYATEVWSMSEADFLKWLNQQVPQFEVDEIPTFNRKELENAEERTQGDLISRDALKKDIDFQFICECCHNNGNTCDICPVAEIEKKIDNASPVETSKIEHKAYNEGFKDGVEQGIKLSETPGEWIYDGHNSTDTDTIFRCSVCHREIHTTIDKLVDYPFCHCGAEMKGGAE